MSYYSTFSDQQLMNSAYNLIREIDDQVALFGEPDAKTIRHIVEITDACNERGIILWDDEEVLHS